MHEYDAIVIGGGPAGSTAAAVLAAKGRRVALLEKERFPRYRVGESLMPYCYFTLARLGVVEKIRAQAYPRKYSVQFVRMDGRVSQPFYFFQHFKHDAATTWQVPRDRFDRILLDNARERGAEVHEATAARELLREGSRVVGVLAGEAGGPKRVFRAPVTLDASGRDAFSLKKLDWRVPDPKLMKVAVWTYYRGALRDPGLDEGATTVAYLPRKGWFWYIPLPDDVVSVGVVADRDYLYRDTRDPQGIFEGEIGNNAWIERHLAPGRRIERFRVTGDYSYRSKHAAGDGLVLLGDAFAFLDPVFSSGVFLALRSGELAAEAVDRALERGDFRAERFRAYGLELGRGFEAMRKLVYAFYDQAFSFRELLTAHPELRGDLTDCLIGNLFRDFGALFEAVGRFADLQTTAGE